MVAKADLDFSESVDYHYGEFPPKKLDYEQLAPSMTSAAAALAKYDALLKTLHNSEVLLAPLRRREAVISSRIEGTIATLEEVLKYEAEEDDQVRQEIIEVLSYSRAMGQAQQLMEEGLPLSGRLLRDTHSNLLFFGRGADKQPGAFKTEPNYIADKNSHKILFTPCNVEKLEECFGIFEKFMNTEHQIPLVQTALCHAEFEAIHPFKDGNGRLGRMLITLMLWDKNLIEVPHFYVSSCIEESRDEYINRLRAVSANGEWTQWCEFFFRIITRQAEENVQIAQTINDLYEEMKTTFREVTASQWSINALDYIFARPIFRNSAFTNHGRIPKQTAHRISSLLAKEGLLSLIEKPSGRRPALYAFEPLLVITRA